jgi:energy-coupling factor transporter ATP-binding protein EcfA2
MYVQEIHINSFRHLEDVHLGPFAQPPDHSDLVVLAGPNGGGKSSVLELLGYALSNSWSLGWSLHRSFPSNSFEVAIAVTPNERSLVRQYLESSQGRYADDALKYFEESGTYYRAYNYAEGRYQENSSLYNQIHNLVTGALRNHYNRSLGFFLRSDRYYPSERFRRNKLFEYDQMTKRDYIWNMAFNTSDVQYRDMFEFLVQQRYHYFRRLGAYYHQLKTVGGDVGYPPSDPLKPYDDLFQKLFPGYRFADADEEVPSNLFVELPSGDLVPFSDLSSGEKEVFFILSFFLRHDVTNAVIVIDEPELHLHPEFARLLVRTMQSIKPGNQIWLATHNTEIIDEAGRDRVVYLARDPQTQKSAVTFGTDEIEAMRQLKDLFGYSGYIGIAKCIVFLEGLDSSSDRKMFSSLFPEYGSKLKFVPCKSSENLARINAAVLSILESNLGWMQFYLIRDRDFLTPEAIQKYRERFSERMYVLNRYHIENYLLDDELIAKVQTDIFGKPTDPTYVREKLKSIARNISGEVLRDMVAFRLNLIYRPEDFSLGDFMKGQAILDGSGEWAFKRVEEFKRHFAINITAINNDLSARTKSEALDALVSQCQAELRQAIIGDSNGWRSLFPGRRLLEEYAKAEGLGKPPVLQNSLIKELSTSPDKVPSELRQVIQTIVDGKTFSQ